MKKTCMNCAYYHGCLAEEEPSFYHIHDYCEKWNCVITKDMESDINSFLENYWADIVWDNASGVNTDLETGEAVCWMYYPKEKEDIVFNDEWFNKNYTENKFMALRTVEHLLETKQYHDLSGEIAALSDDELQSLQIFKDKLLNVK